jgi:hypothetical protein
MNSLCLMLIRNFAFVVLAIMTVVVTDVTSAVSGA